MSISTAEAPPVIEVHGGNVVLGGRPVLRGIDLRVRPGEVVALLGGNGSGKTTLVRAVTGLVPWSHGDVALFGTPLPRFHDWQRIGYAPQRVTAAAGVPASVTEVVGSGRLARRRPFRRPSRADKEAIDAAINTMGLSRQHDVPVAQLSGGQQQRVLIARALAGEPDLFLLDEPNAGVDRQHQGQLATALRPLIESGTAVVLVLHEPGPLAELIHRLVLLRDGRVSEESPGFAAQTCAHPGHGVPVPDNVPLGGAWAAEETR